MKKVRIACKLCGIAVMLIMAIQSNVFASLTKEQAGDVAAFATTFIEKGNERRDEKGYPLLVYALSNNWNTCVEIRSRGYNAELYHVKNNNYHMKNGKFLDLGFKWCMDCGGFISYVYNTTLELDMYLEKDSDPWHIKDMYADANKYENSEIFEFIYKNVPISSIDESKLELGDVVVRLGSRENHGLIYVGDGMQTAHASRNAIKYSKNPPILGFEVVKLDKFYKPSTIVSIVRVKDGVVSENKRVNSTIIWPDTGEKEILINKSEQESETNFSIKGLEDETIFVEKKLEELDMKNITFDISGILFNMEDINSGDFFENNYDILRMIYIEQTGDIKATENPEYIKEQMIEWFIHEFKRLLNNIKLNNKGG